VNASQSISFSVAPIDNATIEWWMNGPTAEGTGSGQGTVSFSNNTAIYTAPSVVTPFGGTNTAPVTICADEMGNSANASCANITIVGCPPPTIASVTPDTWFVGKTYKATIIGTNFIPWFRQLDLAPFDGLNWPHLEACDLSFRVGLGGRSP
jgi:hypothetical protein